MKVVEAHFGKKKKPNDKKKPNNMKRGKERRISKVRISKIREETLNPNGKNNGL